VGNVIICTGTLVGKSHCYKYRAIRLIGSLLVATALLSCSHQTQSRRPNPGVREPKTADQIISVMKTELSLTDEQAVNIRPIIEEQVNKRNELIKKYQGWNCQGPDCLKDQLKDLRISTENQLQYFLTNEQMIKYGYMQQEEDQRISSGKAQDQQDQRIRQGRGRRSANFER